MRRRPLSQRTLGSTLAGGALCLATVLVVLLPGTAFAATGEPRQPRRNLPRTAPPWQHEWARGAVVYEIFVRSFADSDGDGIGDLKGLTARLDYLNDGDPGTSADLGVDALWLMPVFASPSYHGYDTEDYEAINPDYGSIDDFTTLCEEAHRRGIRIILDFVVNHTGSAHPWFVAAASSPASPYRNWYVWSPNDLGWRQPWNIYTGATTWHRNPIDGQWYYGVFWGGMPDLNYRTAAVRQQIKRLATLWLERGADGFRLDAARYIVESGSGLSQQDQPETHAWWRELAAHVRRVKPEATLVGENWAEVAIVATYFGSTETVPGGDELPSNFNFQLAERIIQGVNGSSATAIISTLQAMDRLYPAGVIDAPFLTNHDQLRVATQLGNNAARLRNAAAILLTLPGAPFMYYGEEVGLQNGGPGGADELKRTPMPWEDTEGGGFTTGTPWFAFAPGRESANVAVQLSDPGSLLSRYRALIHARAGSTALKAGTLTVLPQPSSSVLAYLRQGSGERVLVVHNLADGFPVTVGPLAVNATGFDTLLAEPGAPPLAGTSGAWYVTLPPRGSGIWRAR